MIWSLTDFRRWWQSPARYRWLRAQSMECRGSLPLCPAVASRRECHGEASFAGQKRKRRPQLKSRIQVRHSKAARAVLPASSDLCNFSDLQ